MAVLPIAKVGNPILRQIAKPIDPATIGSRRFQEFLDDMFETMVHFEGIGLAAPQVAQSEQVVVMECEGSDGIPKTVLINPKIVFYGPTQCEMWEGCLSIDNMRGKVVRPSMVRVQAMIGRVSSRILKPMACMRFVFNMKWIIYKGNCSLIV